MAGKFLPAFLWIKIKGNRLDVVCNSEISKNNCHNSVFFSFSLFYEVNLRAVRKRGVDNPDGSELFFQTFP